MWIRIPIIVDRARAMVYNRGEFKGVGSGEYSDDKITKKKKN
jgi:hypothetical protein